jgi:phosphate transport system substrate-binding protein
MRKLGLLLLGTLVAAGALATPAPAPAQSPVDPSLPGYRAEQKLEGKLTLSGSYTMAQMASIWSESFRQFHPDVQIEIKVTGAVEAVNSVNAGDADIGMLSRTVLQSEIDAFHAKHGHAPTVLTPTYESIAVFVHKDNPIEGLTLQQLDAIFSATRLRGATKSPATWGDLGVNGQLASQPIACQGRRQATGVQVYFQEVVLAGGEFRTDMQEIPGNVDMVQAIADNPAAIGFAGATFATPDVKSVPLAIEANRPFVAVDSVEAARGQYPLIRPLQLVISQAPGAELPPLQAEFIKYVFSRFGQEDVLRGGLHPISSTPAQTALDAVGLGAVK